MSASDIVRAEWRARIAAEYGSAAATQSFVLWLMQLGAPHELLEDGLAIVQDELVHSKMSHDVYVAAGGAAPPALVRENLGLRRRDPSLEHDVLRAAVQVFCLGETVAVPLFAHLREKTAEPTARAALDRILKDEVRHRDFGWDMLDWLLTTPFADEVPALVLQGLPAMFAELEENYGSMSTPPSPETTTMHEADRAWGLAPPREYAEILARTFEREYRPRFAARGIDIGVLGRASEE